MRSRRRAAWLSLAAVLLGVGVVPALHRVVHAIEEHDDHAPPRRTTPQRRPGHTHGHRHLAAGHHAHLAAPEERVAERGAPAAPAHHHHHHDGDGDGGDRDPLRHGRGSLEHLGAALLASAPPLVPPSPTPSAAPPAPEPLAGCLPRSATRPATIRGPPTPLLHATETLS